MSTTILETDRFGVSWTIASLTGPYSVFGFITVYRTGNSDTLTTLMQCYKSYQNNSKRVSYSRQNGMKWQGSHSIRDASNAALNEGTMVLSRRQKKKKKNATCAFI